jgi:hypothetical protein
LKVSTTTTSFFAGQSLSFSTLETILSRNNPHSIGASVELEVGVLTSLRVGVTGFAVSNGKSLKTHTVIVISVGMLGSDTKTQTFERGIKVECFMRLNNVMEPECLEELA